MNKVEMFQSLKMKFEDNSDIKLTLNTLEEIITKIIDLKEITNKDICNANKIIHYFLFTKGLNITNEIYTLAKVIELFDLNDKQRRYFQTIFSNLKIFINRDNSKTELKF